MGEDLRRTCSRLWEWSSASTVLLIILVTIAAIAGSILVANLVVRAGEAPSASEVPAGSAAAFLAVSPEETQVGQDVTVVGLGWQADDTVLIRLEDPRVGSGIQAPVASVIVEGDGAFSTSFTVPANDPWTSLVRVRVVAFSPAAEQQASIELRLFGVPTVTPSPTATAIPDGGAWQGEYFANRDLVGQPVLVRLDQEVNFNWSVESPADAVPADDFSVRWTRTLPLQEGTYRFFARVDDGVRMWLDGHLLIDQWHDNPAVTYSAEHSLVAGPHTVRIDYYEGQHIALIQFWWVRVGEFPDWRGAYFPDRDLLGSPAVVRNDASIDFNFGLGAPVPDIPVDVFSARWTREMDFDPGVYRFRAFVDDGVRLFVDDVLVIDSWQVGSAREVTGERELSAGSHFLRVEYFEHTGEALIQVAWERVPEVSFSD